MRTPPASRVPVWQCGPTAARGCPWGVTPESSAILNRVASNRPATLVLLAVAGCGVFGAQGLGRALRVPNGAFAQNRTL